MSTLAKNTSRQCKHCGRHWSDSEGHDCPVETEGRCPNCGWKAEKLGEEHLCPLLLPKRAPGRPRNKQVTVAPEQLDSLTTKAREFIGDSDALVAWLNERRMVAIVALGEALTDPKLFLEVTDDLLDAMKDLAPEKQKGRKRS